MSLEKSSVHFHGRCPLGRGRHNVKILYMYMCVCARHFFQKWIQTVRATTLVSRMARRVRIVISRVKKVIRMVINFWMVTTTSTCTAAVCVALRNFLMWICLKNPFKMLVRGVFCHQYVLKFKNVWTINNSHFQYKNAWIILFRCLSKGSRNCQKCWIWSKRSQRFTN